MGTKLNDTGRKALASVAAASAVAGMIHVIAAASHIGDPWSLVFFAGVATFQITWALLTVARPDSRTLLAGAAVNALVAGIWIVSRTSGIPIGTHRGHIEAVGGLDLACTALEMLVVVQSLLIARRELPKRKMLAIACALTAVIATPPASVFASGATAERPHASNVLEAFAKGRVVALTYSALHCTLDPSDDLDGPGHEGDGVIAAEDQDETLNPPCIFGKTRHGSTPKFSPAGGSAKGASRLFAILPDFDADGDGVKEDNDPTPGIDSHCPQPGPPVSTFTGIAQCAMHPALYHAEPIARMLAEDSTGIDMSAVDVPETVLVNGHHSHVLDYTYSENRWWLVFGVQVRDASIWPDRNGSCSAKRGCLTSMAAIRAAQATKKVGPDLPSNIWFLFTVQPVRL